MFGPQNPFFAQQNIHGHINMVEVTAAHITELVKHLSHQNPGLMDAVIRNLAIANQRPHGCYMPYGLAQPGGPGLDGTNGQSRGWPQQEFHTSCDPMPANPSPSTEYTPAVVDDYVHEHRQTPVYWTPTNGGLPVAAVRFNWFKLRGITKEAACNLAKAFAGFTFFSDAGAALCPQDIYNALVTAGNTDSPVAMRGMTVFVHVAEIDVLDRAMARSWDGLSLSQGNVITNPKEDIKRIFDRINAGKVSRLDVSLIDYGNSMGSPQDQLHVDCAQKALIDLGIIRNGDFSEFWLWSVDAPRAGLEEEVRRTLGSIGSDKLMSNLKIFKTL